MDDVGAATMAHKSAHTQYKETCSLLDDVFFHTEQTSAIAEPIPRKEFWPAQDLGDEPEKWKSLMRDGGNMESRSSRRAACDNYQSDGNTHQDLDADLNGQESAAKLDQNTAQDQSTQIENDDGGETPAHHKKDEVDTFDEDIVFDPNYFKKAKDKREANRKLELARKAAKKFVSDMDERYSEGPVGEVEVREPEQKSRSWEKPMVARITGVVAAAAVTSFVSSSKEKDNKRDEHKEGRPKLYKSDDASSATRQVTLSGLILANAPAALSKVQVDSFDEEQERKE
jgi:hypothetical protein